VKEENVIVTSLRQTKEFAQKFAQKLKGGDVICLIGNLGSGKTYLTKFIAETLGVEEKEIISPTFVYYRKHKGKKFTVNHFDFYRIEDEFEAESIALDDALSKDTITFIEWADKIPSLLPQERITIKIKNLGGEKREFLIRRMP